MWLAHYKKLGNPSFFTDIKHAQRENTQHEKLRNPWICWKITSLYKPSIKSTAVKLLQIPRGNRHLWAERRTEPYHNTPNGQIKYLILFGYSLLLSYQQRGHLRHNLPQDRPSPPDVLYASFSCCLALAPSNTTDHLMSVQITIHGSLIKSKKQRLSKGH